VEVSHRHGVTALLEIPERLEQQVAESVPSRVVAHPSRLEGCVLAIVREDQQTTLVVGARCADHLLSEDVDVCDGGRAKRADRLARPAALRPAARSAPEAPESLPL
jgi:hypothetical protein